MRHVNMCCVQVLHNRVQKDCAFGSARFRSYFTHCRDTDKSQYRITIEDPKGVILKDFPPSSAASTALCLAHRAMYVKSRHKTFWSSPDGWNSRVRKRFFPILEDTVQVQLIRKLLSRQADYERLSPASVQQKVSAFIKRCSSPKANASLLANVSVLVMRRDKEDNIIKTQKTNNPSCTKVPLTEFALSTGCTDMILVEHDRLKWECRQREQKKRRLVEAKSSILIACSEKRKAVRQMNAVKAKAIFIKKMRLGKNKPHSPMTTWSRIFSLKVCNAGGVSDSKYQPLIQVTRWCLSLC